VSLYLNVEEVLAGITSIPLQLSGSLWITDIPMQFLEEWPTKILCFIV